MTTQSEKESSVKQLGHLPYGGCPNAVPFFLWSGLRDSLGSLSRSPTRTRPPKQPPAVSLLCNGLFEPRILMNAKKKHRSASSFSWSGLRDSNSLPPPWQGGALPDELNPHLWCFRTESNHRHGDFQSPALPTELQKHIMATRNGLEPSTSCVTGRRSNQLNYRAKMVGVTGLEPVTLCL